jgi:hypothetical protein
MKPDIERECVRRLLLELGRRADEFALESPNPPAPDVRVCWRSGDTDVVEVTEVHPDEVLGQGSAARADEEQRARRDPQDTTLRWIEANALPALSHRVLEKVRKSSGYALQPGESLSLLLAASLAMYGAAASTSIAWPFLNETVLNQHLHAALCASRFERAYLHLQLWHGLWEWSRPQGWRALQAPRSVEDGNEALAMLRQHAGRALLPGTEVVGRWP